MGDTDNEARRLGLATAYCRLSSTHAVGLGVYIGLSALVLFVMALMRNTTVLCKRHRGAVFVFAAQCLLAGAVALSSVLCSEQGTALQRILEAVFEYLNLGTIAYLYLFRILAFVEIEMRNQSALLRINSGAQISKTQNFTNFEKLVFGLLGFKNIVAGRNGLADAVSADTSAFRFSRIRLFRALLINLAVCAVACFVTLGALWFAVGRSRTRLVENLDFIWLGLVLVSTPYLLFFARFTYRIAWIKDKYWIRVEFIVQTAILGLSALSVVGIILWENMAGGRLGVNGIMLVAFTAIALVQITQFLAITLSHASLAIAARWGRQAANVSAVTFAEFEVQLSDTDFLSQLKPHLIAEFCIENAYFIEDFDNSVNRHRSIISKAATEVDDYDAANVLFEKFIRKRSANELNLPHQVTCQLSRKRRMRTLRLSDFDAVRRHVARLMYENSYGKYIEHRSSLLLTSRRGSYNL